MSLNVSLKPGWSGRAQDRVLAVRRNGSLGERSGQQLTKGKEPFRVEKPANRPIARTETLHTRKEASLTGRRPVDPIAAGAGPRPATMLRDARRAAILSLSCSC